tara:strand:+ start:143 stop:442 length:300 start_codon:yes stop_codon:yes gene_type:complete
MGESQWIICSSSFIEINGETMCDEVMAFQSNADGDLFTASYLDVRYPHSVDHKVHQALASSAYDELAKQHMGVDGGMQELRDEEANTSGCTLAHMEEAL